MSLQSPPRSLRKKPRPKAGLAERPAKLGPQSLSLSRRESWAGTRSHPPLAQSRRASLVEVGLSTFAGFWLAVGANMIFLPLFPEPGAFSSAFSLGLIFTLISLARGYLFRRAFNLLHKKGILQ